MSEQKGEKRVIEQKWAKETEERKPAIIRFLSEYFNDPIEERMSRYNGLTELHFSGANMEVMDKIKQGTAILYEVNVYYEGGVAKQIHAVFLSEGAGHNIDVYITGKALVDCLAESNKI